MSIPATCPDCGASYQLDSRLAGKRVRCQGCASEFKVAVPEVQAIAPRAKLRAEPVKKRQPRRESWEDRYPGEEQPRTQEAHFPLMLWILGGIFGGVLLVMLACGGLIFYFTC
jgi:predicted Zn finger-like uncharacterized protein